MAYFTTFKTFDYLFCRIFIVLGFVLVIILVFLIMHFFLKFSFCAYVKLEKNQTLFSLCFWDFASFLKNSLSISNSVVIIMSWAGSSFENRLEERCLKFDLVLNIFIRELLMNNLFLVKLIGN